MTILSIKNRAASLQKRQSYRKTEMGFETHGIASQKKAMMLAMILKYQKGHVLTEEAII